MELTGKCLECDNGHWCWQSWHETLVSVVSQYYDSVSGDQENISRFPTQTPTNHNQPKLFVSIQCILEWQQIVSKLWGYVYIFVMQSVAQTIPHPLSADRLWWRMHFCVSLKYCNGISGIFNVKWYSNQSLSLILFFINTFSQPFVKWF